MYLLSKLEKKSRFESQLSVNSVLLFTMFDRISISMPQFLHLKRGYKENNYIKDTEL